MNSKTLEILRSGCGIVIIRGIEVSMDCFLRSDVVAGRASSGRQNFKKVDFLHIKEMPRQLLRYIILKEACKVLSPCSTLSRLPVT